MFDYAVKKLRRSGADVQVDGHDPCITCTAALGEHTIEVERFWYDGSILRVVLWTRNLVGQWFEDDCRSVTEAIRKAGW
tara:strand:- start:131 stop:367 length:237 start_codon:yes stop_codon:yes gene_type:complete